MSKKVDWLFTRWWWPRRSTFRHKPQVIEKLEHYKKNMPFFYKFAITTYLTPDWRFCRSSPRSPSPGICASRFEHWNQTSEKNESFELFTSSSTSFHKQLLVEINFQSVWEMERWLLIKLPFPWCSWPGPGPHSSMGNHNFNSPNTLESGRDFRGIKSWNMITTLELKGIII